MIFKTQVIQNKLITVYPDHCNVHEEIESYNNDGWELVSLSEGGDYKSRRLLLVFKKYIDKMEPLNETK